MKKMDYWLHLNDGDMYCFNFHSQLTPWGGFTQPCVQCVPWESINCGGRGREGLPHLLAGGGIPDRFGWGVVVHIHACMWGLLPHHLKTGWSHTHKPHYTGQHRQHLKPCGCYVFSANTWRLSCAIFVSDQIMPSWVIQDSSARS